MVGLGGVELWMVGWSHPKSGWHETSWKMRFGSDDFLLGGVFKYFIFSPLFGEDSHFD